MPQKLDLIFTLVTLWSVDKVIDILLPHFMR